MLHKPIVKIRVGILSDKIYLSTPVLVHLDISGTGSVGKGIATRTCANINCCRNDVVYLDFTCWLGSDSVAGSPRPQTHCIQQSIKLYIFYVFDSIKWIRFNKHHVLCTITPLKVKHILNNYTVQICVKISKTWFLLNNIKKTNSVMFLI